MTSQLQEKQLDDRTYTLTVASESEAEMRRLDEMHTAITRYFDGKLSLAPLADVRPRKILELGCGSGAWSRAIQAATEFPEAEIFAVDVSPIPNREIPSNISFKLGDLTKTLDFETATFDIVHARFVMIHVPNAEEAIKRAATLVKPGGLLILEDADITSMLRTGGKAAQEYTSRLIPVFESRKSDPEMGRKLAGIMTSTGYFPDVQVHKVAVPMSENGTDGALNELGLGLKKSMLRAVDAITERAAAETPDDRVAKEFREELESKDCKAAQELYFCWARRALE
ncbi:S-adenosyl-L-methionine-dependent methyltransferase [Mycena polygramma]|nr:S-adenosyl-L-methionine-dependent methyltransferase [Mycena polygramma]